MTTTLPFTSTKTLFDSRVNYFIPVECSDGAFLMTRQLMEQSAQSAQEDGIHPVDELIAYLELNRDALAADTHAAGLLYQVQTFLMSGMTN